MSSSISKPETSKVCRIKITLFTFVSILLLGSEAYAGRCADAEAQFDSYSNALNQEQPNGAAQACQITAKLSKAAIAFMDKCPESDPDGLGRSEMMLMFEEAVDCANSFDGSCEEGVNCEDSWL